MDKKTEFLLQLNKYACKNKIPTWFFGEKNAYLSIYAGMFHTNLFDLLISYIFLDELCLHKSIHSLDGDFNVLDVSEYELNRFKYPNSGLSQKDYYLKYISIYFNYNEFLRSALFYYLKIKIKKNELYLFISVFSSILIINNRYTIILYNDLLKLNLFLTFPSECLDGFFSYFTNSKITMSFIFAIKKPEDLFLIEKQHRIFRIMTAFSFSLKLRSCCFKDCIDVQNFIPFFLALKVYQTKLLFPGLTQSELFTVNSFSSFRKSMLDSGKISKKKMTKLTIIYWKYLNYEKT